MPKCLTLPAAMSPATVPATSSSGGDVLGPADQAGRAARLVEPEPELGGDHDLVTYRGEGLADEFLVEVGPVDLGGVEERDTAVHRGPDEPDHLLPVPGVGAVALAHPHAAKPDRRDHQVMSQGPLFHRYLPSDVRWR